MANNGRGVLLRNPVLGVCAIETLDDVAARQLIEKLIKDIDPSVRLKVVKQENVDQPTPWLRSSLSTW